MHSNIVSYLIFNLLITFSFQRKQGWHRLVEYLNIEGFHKKSLKMKSSLKSTEKYSKDLEKHRKLYFFSVGFYTADEDLSLYKTALPLFGAENNDVS